MYKGYADDPRNTDNAWLETRVVNYHDEDGTILENFQLRVGFVCISLCIYFVEQKLI